MHRTEELTPRCPHQEPTMTIAYPTWTVAIGLALVWFYSSRPTWLVVFLVSVLAVSLVSDVTRSSDSAR
ncbi:MAG: hypothetical protein Q3997_04820 [Propionibacteriaceae bacterium]|nr:hypothetical protein [Propionibacteriaceae bacterium]